MAQRIQLRRTKGWRKPDGAVVVARPSVWGNPYIIHDHPDALLGGCEEHDYDCVADAGVAVLKYRHAILWPVIGQPRVPTPDYIRQELRGKDLACWCPLDQPCHADVLLELANAIGGPCPTAGVAAVGGLCPAKGTESSGASGAGDTSSRLLAGPDSVPTSPSSGEIARTSSETA